MFIIGYYSPGCGNVHVENKVPSTRLGLLRIGKKKWRDLLWHSRHCKGDLCWRIWGFKVINCW